MSYGDPYGDMPPPQDTPRGSSRRSNSGGGGRGRGSYRRSSGSGNAPNLDGYVEVKDRIKAFYEKYPDGRIQSEVIPGLSVIQEVLVDEVEKRNDDGTTTTKQVPYGVGYVAVKAYAYRTPDDPLPATGMSGMFLPGTTPYTRGSELENAETSAWGRALANLDILNDRGIASKDEVRKASGAEIDDELAADAAFQAAQQAQSGEPEAKPTVDPVMAAAEAAVAAIEAAPAAAASPARRPDPRRPAPSQEGNSPARPAPEPAQAATDATAAPDSPREPAVAEPEPPAEVENPAVAVEDRPGMPMAEFVANLQARFVHSSIVNRLRPELFPQSEKAADLTDQERAQLWDAIVDDMDATAQAEKERRG